MTVGGVGGGAGGQNGGGVQLPSLDALRNQVGNLTFSQRAMLLAKDPVPKDSDGKPNGPADPTVSALLANPQINAAMSDPKLNMQIGEDNENLKAMNKAFDKLLDRLNSLWQDSE